MNNLISTKNSFAYKIYFFINCTLKSIQGVICITFYLIDKYTTVTFRDIQFKLYENINSFQPQINTMCV